MCRWPTRCTILINNFFIPPFFFCFTCFERITRPSSGARHNILYHAVQSVQSVQVCLDSPARLYRLYCVIQYTRQCSWWWTSNDGIKIIYKNCASRCSPTRCTVTVTYFTHFYCGPKFGNQQPSFCYFRNPYIRGPFIAVYSRIINYSPTYIFYYLSSCKTVGAVLNSLSLQNYVVYPSLMFWK